MAKFIPVIPSGFTSEAAETKTIKVQSKQRQVCTHARVQFISKPKIEVKCENFLCTQKFNAVSLKIFSTMPPRVLRNFNGLELPFSRTGQLQNAGWILLVLQKRYLEKDYFALIFSIQRLAQILVAFCCPSLIFFLLSFPQSHCYKQTSERDISSWISEHSLVFRASWKWLSRTHTPVSGPVRTTKQRTV